MTTQFGPLSVGEDGAGIWEEVSETAARPRYERRVASLSLKAFEREEDQCAPLPLEATRARRLALAQMFAAAPAMVEALGSLYEQVERHLDRCKGWLPDHACAECVPHSEILVEGFQCGRHAARAALKKAGR